MKASVQALIKWNLRFPAALARLETIFPRLFFMSISRVRPDLVFSFEPRKTTERASFPEATLDTRFAFITFMAFIAAFFFMTFMAFIAAFFFMTFMAFIAAIFFMTFMAFIAFAIVFWRTRNVSAQKEM